MTDFARPNDLGRAAALALAIACQSASSASVRPASPSPPTRSKSRRVMPPHNCRAEPKIRSMTHALGQVCE